MQEERLETIETKLAYQEYSLQQLNDVITEQQDTIDKLELMVVRLAERMRGMSAQMDGDSLDPQERPPHY